MPRSPLVAPGRFLPDEAAAVDAAIARVVSSGSWILGEEVAGFESEFAEYTGATDTIACANGTDALVLALVALAPSRGAEVLVPANDGGYAALAVTAAGLRPIVYDIDARSGAPTVDTLDAARTQSTEAAIITHLHGDLVDLDPIDRWRRRHGLALVEDCAQAHGLRNGTTHAGTIGDLGTFSFYPTKNLGAIGDGGALIVGDGIERELLSQRLRALRQYGWVERNRIELTGGRNSRLDELQAAVLRARLPFLDDRNQRRRDLVERWREATADVASVERISTDGPTVAHQIVATFTTAESRDRAIERLSAEGVTTAVHYPWLVQEMPGIDATESSPVAADRRSRILSLPAEPLLDGDEIDHVAACLARLE